MNQMDETQEEMKIWQKVGFFTGPILFLAMLLFPPSFVVESGIKGAMTYDAWKVAACGLWMAIWWVTEAAPIPITSLLPIPLFYLLNVSNTAPKTANETLREIGKPELSKYFSEQILAPLSFSRWIHFSNRNGKMELA